MVFSSVIFIFAFFPVTLLIYFVLNKFKNIEICNIWLLIMSLFFYGWSVYMLKKPSYFLIIIVSILINYLGALCIDKYNNIKKLILLLTVALNLLLLGYFKYFNFLIRVLNDAFSQNIGYFNIVLPIGISFFTFQGISYVADVYRGDVQVQKNPLKIALYISLFPQLIAGPIVRYKDVVLEIEHRQIDLNGFSYGIERFIVGLAKKVIIANSVAMIVDKIWKVGISNQTIGTLWVGSIAYTLQIFFDFSGYSDMAIGLGRMFGFHFYENFNMPYISRNITDFWRRWHISLSSFFRDYVYIPLGGNRRHLYMNLIIVFFLTGLWHGAQYQFILWGIFHGVFIIIERLLRKNKLKENDNLFIILLSIMYTMFVVNIGWIFFRATNVETAINYIGIMFGIIKQSSNTIGLSYYLSNWGVLMIVIGIIFSSMIPMYIYNFFKKINNDVTEYVKYVLLIVLFVITIIRVISGTYNPFIYFQF